jgi:hypothetical protein
MPFVIMISSPPLFKSGDKLPVSILGINCMSTVQNCDLYTGVKHSCVSRLTSIVVTILSNAVNFNI